jgi:hypothetical protein
MENIGKGAATPSPMITSKRPKKSGKGFAFRQSRFPRPPTERTSPLLAACLLFFRTCLR